VYIRQVIQGGCLQIPWPTLLNGDSLPLDLLLAPVTRPSLDAAKDYPDVESIAKAWNDNDHVYYFRCNRWTGIHTADDEAIEKLLSPPKARSAQSHRA
jgi:hypothetical protein